MMNEAYFGFFFFFKTVDTSSCSLPVPLFSDESVQFIK